MGRWAVKISIFLLAEEQSDLDAHNPYKFLFSSPYVDHACFSRLDLRLYQVLVDSFSALLLILFCLLLPQLCTISSHLRPLSIPLHVHLGLSLIHDSNDFPPEPAIHPTIYLTVLATSHVTLSRSPCFYSPYTYLVHIQPFLLVHFGIYVTWHT